MVRMTFRAIAFVSILSALVLSVNLLVGAQAPMSSPLFDNQGKDKEKTKDKDKTKDKSKDSSKKKDDGMAPSAAADSSRNSADSKFIMEAAHGGMMEVEMGRMGVEKATSEEVKKYAQRIVDDHTKANQELTTLASQKEVTLSAADGKHKAMMDKTSAKMTRYSGADFDRRYIEEMIKDHEKAIAMFEKESRNGQDADVKAWATNTLPTLREHLQAAQSLYASMGGKSAKGDKKGADKKGADKKGAKEKQ